MSGSVLAHLGTRGVGATSGVTSKDGEDSGHADGGFASVLGREDAQANLPGKDAKASKAPAAAPRRDPLADGPFGLPSDVAADADAADAKVDGASVDPKASLSEAPPRHTRSDDDAAQYALAAAMLPVYVAAPPPPPAPPPAPGAAGGGLDAVDLKVGQGAAPAAGADPKAAGEADAAFDADTAPGLASGTNPQGAPDAAPADPAAAPGGGKIQISASAHTAAEAAAQLAQQAGQQASAAARASEATAASAPRTAMTPATPAAEHPATSATASASRDASGPQAGRSKIGPVHSGAGLRPADHGQGVGLGSKDDQGTGGGASSDKGAGADGGQQGAQPGTTAVAAGFANATLQAAHVQADDGRANGMTAVSKASAPEPPAAVTSERLREALASVTNHAVLRSSASGHIDVPELGRVAVRAHANGGVVDVDVSADRADARALLRGHLGGMTADLHQAAVPTGRVSIERGATNFSNSEGAASRDQGASGQGTQRDPQSPVDHDEETPGADPGTAKRVRIVL